MSSRGRRSNYSLRSVKRWHRLPTVEAGVPYEDIAAGGTMWMTVRGTTFKRFTGFTMAHAVRRAHRWIESR